MSSGPLDLRAMEDDAERVEDREVLRLIAAYREARADLAAASLDGGRCDFNAMLYSLDAQVRDE